MVVVTIPSAVQKIGLIDPVLDIQSPFGPVSIFRDFVEAARESDWQADRFAKYRDTFLIQDGLLLVLVDPQLSDPDLGLVIKLPDILSNSFGGAADPPISDICDKVAKNIALAHVWSTNPDCPSAKALEKNVGQALDRFILNFNGFELGSESLVKYAILNGEHQVRMDALLAHLGPETLHLLFKSFSRHAKSSEALASVFSEPSVSSHRTVWSKVLLARRKMPTVEQRHLIGFLAQQLDPAELCELFMTSLKLWGDPVIAKAYVSQEVIHYTRISALLFHHVASATIQKHQNRIIESLVAGLPNHFQSADGRTILLAKFFSDLLTANLGRICNADTGPLPTPEDALSWDIVAELKLCLPSRHFWFNPGDYPAADQATISDPKAQALTDRAQSDEESLGDEDANDLEPIESIEAPPKVKMVYLRQFLERFPELEQFSETQCALEMLPEVLRHQLALEHPKLGQEVIDSLFFWENKFEDAALDLSRKESLSLVLHTQLESNIQHFCSLFHKEHIQSFRKNMILDVLSQCAEGLPLKDLQTLAKHSFNDLLLDASTIRLEDVVVQVPFVMYLTKLVRIMPEMMLTEDFAGKYLKAIANMTGIDAPTEEVIRYALGSVLPRLEHLQSQDLVQIGLNETRKWLISIENGR